MKKVLIAICALGLTACGYADPNAGEEGVLVRKPWFFGDGGVDPQPLKTGSHIVAWSTDVIRINVTPRAFEVKFDDLMPNNGIPLDFVTTVRLQVTDSAALVRDWGGAIPDEHGNPSDAWYWRNINPAYENFVRDAVKKYSMDQLALSGAAISAVDHEVSQKLEGYLRQNKMPVKLLGVTVGRANPPEAIKEQRIETQREQQREQTMVAQQRAEVSRKQAELARAEADNAYRSQMSLTPEQFVDLERINMQRDVCTKGKGCTFIIGNGSALVSR